jgi:hypothetical protein
MTEYNTIKHANGDFYQPNTIKIEMDIEDYIYLLDNRRNFVENHYNWHIPDCLWEYFCDLSEFCMLHKQLLCILQKNLQIIITVYSRLQYLCLLVKSES